MSNLAAEIERELAGEPELAEYRRRQKPDQGDYPRPTQAEIEDGLERLRHDFNVFHTNVRDNRDVRHLRDRMPEKWAKELEIGEREHIHSRLSQNMIQRIVAMATRNPPKVTIKPAGKTDKEQEKARKQTRWASNVWPSFERARAKRRAVIDSQCGDGLGILEIYRTGAYDRLKLDEFPGESPQAYMKRTEEQYVGAGMPYGVRSIDPLAIFWDEDGTEGDPVCEAYIEEDIAQAPVYRALRKAGVSADWFAKHQEKKRRGVQGQAVYNGKSDERPSQVVRRLTYYDRRWMATMIDGVLVGEIEEHGMGFVPLVFYEGMTTGSVNRSERYQGVFDGMYGLEKAVNWLTTLELDNAFTLSKPKIAITTPMGGAGGIDPNRPITSAAGPVTPISFRGGQVPRLRPGEVPVNLTETFRGHDTAPVRAWIMQLIQISGLNPVAQGESPGSDPAGYAINALQSAAQANYEVLLDNAARADSDLVNKLRNLIRNDLKQPWYLTAPMEGRKQTGSTWLGLGPDDITAMPAHTTIDPLSDVNRIAVTQDKRQSNKEGYIARWRVQDAMGVEDFDAEDMDILEDTMESELGRVVIEDVKMAVIEAAQQMPLPPPSGLVGPDGQPIQSAAPQGAGATPAPLNPPSVGPAAAASQAPFATQPGPSAQPGSSARAGQMSSNTPGGTA